MSKLFACISHKGGTGRTVTTANIAYHLAAEGHDVCIVDLDLASPTLGAVVGLSDISAGALDSKGIHNILYGDVIPENVELLLRDVWESPDISGFHSFSSGEFRLLPGTNGGSDMLLSYERSEERERLRRVLQELLARYEFVFCDLRSGIGSVAHTFVSSPVAEKVYAWILFHRWTRQHLAGVIDLAQRLNEAVAIEPSPRFMTVRTAKIDPESVPPGSRTWINQRDDELWAEHKKLSSATNSELTNLGTIPSELLLQWNECILTEALLGSTTAKATADSFRDVATRLVELEE